MSAKTFTIFDDTLRFSPAYASLGGNAARILLEIVAGLKRAFRQGRLDETALGWINFPQAILPFKVHHRTFAKALNSLKQVGFIQFRRFPGRPYQIAMSREWRSAGHCVHYFTTQASGDEVPTNPPSDSPLKSFNQDHTIRKERQDGGQLAVEVEKPEEKPRPPVVDVDALCVSLGDVAGVEGRYNVRRAIAGKPRKAIVRAWKAIMAEKGVRCKAALFVWRLKNASRPPKNRATAAARPSCPEPASIGAIAQHLLPRVAEDLRLVCFEQHRNTTGAPPAHHRSPSAGIQAQHSLPILLDGPGHEGALEVS